MPDVIIGFLSLTLSVFTVFLFVRLFSTLKYLRLACQLYLGQNLQLKEKAKKMREEYEYMTINEIANMLDVDIRIVEHWLEED
ncbi:hypothetical protein C6496_13945 [Candidatus Poribacteria bacterium]|nr:MAG: hypothetical protein C6496_13945 [Candidatus Poribacteria bacterium]